MHEDVTLICVGCDAKYLMREGIGDTSHATSIADLVCPKCTENLQREGYAS